MKPLAMPHCEEIERSIIAALILEPYLVDKALSLGVREEMFFSQALRLLWNAGNSIYNRAGELDIILLADELRGRDSEFGGDICIFLMDLQNAIATTAAFREWCLVLKQRHAARQIIKNCAETIDKISSGEPVNTVITSLQDCVSAAAREIDGRERKTVETLLQSVIGVVAENKAVVPLCIPGTDDLLLRKKNLHILGAMPGTGKTAFALNSMQERAKNGFTDCIFCAETSAEALMKRLLSIEAGLPIERLDDLEKMNKAQLARYKDAAKTIHDLKDHVYIFGKGDYQHTPEGIRCELKRLQDVTGGRLDAVTIDYLQNMRARGNLAKANRAEQIEEFIFSLNETFGELNLAATVLCQLSRDKDRAKTNRAPGIYDLKGSSAIEQEADFITFLHKENSPPAGIIELRWYSEKIRGSKTIDTLLRYDTITSRYLQ